MVERRMNLNACYDVVIVGGGHNGLVAANYLAMAGRSVLLLERRGQLGGATRSARVFPGLDANLSVYSYLVSLFPERIVKDLGLRLDLLPRRIASFTPDHRSDAALLVHNEDPSITQANFERLPGGSADYAGYQRMQAAQSQLAQAIWPTLLHPLTARADIEDRLNDEARQAWHGIVDEPLGNWIESHIAHDLIRGLVFTDAKIGVATFPHDPRLLQNRTYLMHIMGRGTGAWHPPRGGMGALVQQLAEGAQQRGATLVTSAEVTRVDPGPRQHEVAFEIDGTEQVVGATFVLHNNAGAASVTPEGEKQAENEGSVFKINLLLERLPRTRSGVSANDAFTGTFHVAEGYAKMTADVEATRNGQWPDEPACEIYCHSLTDPSILSTELQRRGFHTLTCFGLDAPYSLFPADPAGHEAAKQALLERTFAAINRELAEPIESCLATDAKGAPCIECKSPRDLETELGLPQGNIFHTAPDWPFAQDASEVGMWGVETEQPRVFVCGSSARRGGCVSGIPGHNAAQAVLGYQAEK